LAGTQQPTKINRLNAESHQTTPLRKRYSKNLTSAFHYTWGKNLSRASGDIGGYYQGDARFRAAALGRPYRAGGVSDLLLDSDAKEAAVLPESGSSFSRHSAHSAMIASTCS
jgi:hypothetical protein